MNAALEVSLDASVTASASVELRFVEESPAEREARRRALLAEAKAWRWLADRYGRGDTDRVWLFGYLCMDADECLDREKVSAEVHASMKRRLEGHLELAGHYVQRGGNYFGNSDDPRSRKPRAIAADFLALECEDEAAALRPAPRSPSRRSSKRGGGNG